jgi:hypothetical protein
MRMRERTIAAHKNCFHFHNETSQHKPLMNRAKCDHYSKRKHEKYTHRRALQTSSSSTHSLLLSLSLPPLERDHFNNDVDNEDEHAQRYIYMYCIGSASIRSICLS